MSDMEKTTGIESIPYVVHEGEMARQERTIKRLWILCIIIFIALVGTNAGWIYYESQFETVVSDVRQDIDSGDGNVTAVGIGDIYGTSEADSEGKDAP